MTKWMDPKDIMRKGSDGKLFLLAFLGKDTPWQNAAYEVGQFWFDDDFGQHSWNTMNGETLPEPYRVAILYRLTPDDCSDRFEA